MPAGTALYNHNMYTHTRKIKQRVTFPTKNIDGRFLQFIGGQLFAIFDAQNVDPGKAAGEDRQKYVLKNMSDFLRRVHQRDSATGSTEQ